MGVSLSQWRSSIGTFNVFSIKTNCCKFKNLHYFKDHIFNILPSFAIPLPIRISFGLLILLSYSFMIISLVPLGFILYPYSIFAHDMFTTCDYPVVKYFAYISSVITIFPYKIKVFITNIPSLFTSYFSEKMENMCFTVIVLVILLLMSGTVEINPGPPSPKLKNLSFAVWNLDSLPARDFARVPLIETLQSTYDFDLFGICESMLSEKNSNEEIFISGFSPDPFRADKAPNIRNGGVCLYFKESLPIKQRNDLQKLPETIVAEIKLKKKKIFFVLSYRHPNMITDEVVEYMNSLEKIYESIRKENPYVSILCGDFNARSPVFWEGDTENNEGRLLSDILISNSLEQLICEPTHVRDDGSQSCVDLICTNQPFIFTKTGVLPSLDSHSKHNIIHGTLSINMPRPPSYRRKIWDYKSAKNDRICADLSNINWQDLFFNLNASEMSLIFTDVFLDIIARHTSSKIVKFNDKDAPWITPQVKTAIKRNSRVYRKWVNRGRNPNVYDSVRKVQNETNKLINEAKSSYFTNLGTKLSDPKTGQKQFWTAYKKLANQKQNTNIPPIIKDGMYISNFKEKSEIFNEYFAKQCTINDNGSLLPRFIPTTNASLSHIFATKEQIIKTINDLNSNKAHGCDGISVSMLKLCANEIAVPLLIIFNKCINSGQFPESWKYANAQPIHKKDDRQIVSNYRPISLLPICGKILEKIVFDQVYTYLNVNNLLSKNQSGFRPGDSTIYQLLSITSSIFEDFEKYDETRAIFLDISKAFDKVWHEGLIFKLQRNGISGNLLTFFQNYLSNRHQRVVLNGQESKWMCLGAGVPQGSVLGPLLFLVYINDLTDNILCDMRLFADDSSLFTCVKGVDATHEKLVNDLETVTSWAYQWKMVFNPDITKQAIEVIFSCKTNKPEHPELWFNEIPIARKPFTKHLGVYLDSRLNFSKHIKEKVLKAMKGISLLKFLSKYVDRNVLSLSYKMYIRPHLDYGDVIYHNQRADLMDLVERVQYKAALIVSGCWQGTSRKNLYDELGWESLTDRRWLRRLTIFYKITNDLAPSYLSEHIPKRNEINMVLRDRNINSPFVKTDRYENSFFPYTIKAWKNLDEEAKSQPSVKSFKTYINKNYLRSPGYPLFGICDKIGVKLLTKIRVNFSDLRDHRFHHNFNCSTPLCRCGLDDETSVHYFLCCPLFTNVRATFLSKISDTIHSDVTVLPNEHLLHILLYGSNVYNDITNKLIISDTITFIRNSGRFTVLEAFS